MVAHTGIIIFIITLSVNYFQFVTWLKNVSRCKTTDLIKDFFEILPTLDEAP